MAETLPRLDVWNPEENGCRKKCTVYLSYWTGDRRISKKNINSIIGIPGCLPQMPSLPPPQEDSGLIKGDDFFGTMMVDKRLK